MRRLRTTLLAGATALVVAVGLSAALTAALIANRTAIGPWEEFDLIND